MQGLWQQSCEHQCNSCGELGQHRACSREPEHPASAFDALQAQAHSAIDRADGLEPFRAPQASPVLAAIQQAAVFTAKGHDPQEEAAKVSQLLHRLLDPVIIGDKTRWLIDRLNHGQLPWPRSLRRKRMPKCPGMALRRDLCT